MKCIVSIQLNIFQRKEGENSNIIATLVNLTRGSVYAI